ncbi:unnamed protein product [Schistocephalus solidus]|uniref:Reverse transcriptase domain-containing protein n=1 Tax=Schistocephalus solidus TaxID=70667 RepID=A0A183S9C7_SCHSO|nr:unnamed protein product [Schistocephalus solidus]
MNEIAKSTGFSINAGKTKVVSNDIHGQEKTPPKINSCQLEGGDRFRYLWARPPSDGQSKDSTVVHIDAARRVFLNLGKCLWIRRDISIATKTLVYRAVLLNTYDFWTARVDERKLEVFDHHDLKTILRVNYADFLSNEVVHTSQGYPMPSEKDSWVVWVRP